ncbi:hypothetical protein PR001_g1280 [Phytophthora rubi]|uniref:Protein kinase domain-containing protein n=1 Tax=Phytophthora rubi TaxID=129364 RepID=A0A6A3P7I1_9STRA|nr:hypothetical protein PR001_g1280 [Phytophthora rubi]
MFASSIYLDSSCVGKPNAITMGSDPTCDDKTHNGTCVEEKTYFFSSKCIEDPFDYAAEVYASTKFVVQEKYNKSGCQDLMETDAFPASGSCVQVGLTDSYMFTVSLNDTTGAVNITEYKGDTCTEKTYFFTIAASGKNVSTQDEAVCVNGIYKLYSIHDSALRVTSSSSSSGSDIEAASGGSGIGTGAIAGIVVAVIVVVLFALGFLWYRRRSNARADSDGDKHDGGYASVSSPKTGQSSNSPGTVDFSSSVGMGPQSLAALWDDEIIATSRIPREKVLVQQLLNRGGYGEVFYGLYNGQRVALKMLLPEFRKSIKHVNDFLDEVRLLALLEHPRIVHFVGVAWDSLSDLCAVLEYMEGGDLRALLASYEAQGHELGFDRTKVTIALHVAHALTYLHSLDPPVLHRDLKSKNILLTSDLEAKLTDFGISRERVDKTMTAGVGTSLWMAPEVMMGERYDDKADIFSFGVVLSELDLHTLPYAHAKESSNSGRKTPDTAILQMVALGKIRVEFSPQALDSMVVLASACVALNPEDRPTAAEALYHLQTILRD